MLNVKRILFPTDLSDTAESAFGYAVDLGRHFGAEIHVLNVRVPYSSDPEGPFAYFDMEEEGEGLWSDAGTVLLPSSGVRVVHAQIQAMPAASGILQYAADHEVDFIVMGTHGRRGLARLFLGGTTQAVVHRAACPVLTVHREAPMKPEEIKSILAPVDFTSSSGTVVRAAVALARAFDARLHLLHVLGLPDTGGEGALTIPPDVAGIVREAETRLIEEIQEAAGLDYEVHVRLGEPASSIVAFAQEKGADLVVLASDGQAGFGRLLLGGKTETILQTAPCPVLTLKSVIARTESIMSGVSRFSENLAHLRSGAG